MLPLTTSVALCEAVLAIEPAREIDRIARALREILTRNLKRRGLVVALSGGVDSSVCAALAVAALGPRKVFALLLPERDSSPDSVRLGRQVAEQLGVQYQVQEIGPVLDAIGCYRMRDEAIRRAVPEYGEGWRCKLAIHGAQQGAVNHFRLVVADPQGEVREVRLSLPEYLQIVASTNYKQRVRKSIEYFHADRLNYAVVGTPNRLEYDQGFFVKNGDGAADVKPIAHLYKSQVYALAGALGIPREICEARPTTDTYSLPQGQDEFYFALPYAQMDLALWAHNHNLSAQELGRALGITEAQAERIYADIESKRRTTAYQHARPYLVDEVEQVGEGA